MSRGSCVLVLALATAWALTRADAPKGEVTPYHLGRSTTDADIAAAGISVSPDGNGLPPGGASALEGRPIYESLCASCHGPKGQGTEIYPALAGGNGSLKSEHPILTIGSYWPYATTVWDYINRAMPFQNPGTLTPQQVYALTAYVLYLNNIVGEREVVSQRTLARIHMPNRNGFVADPRPDVHQGTFAEKAQKAR